MKGNIVDNSLKKEIKKSYSLLKTGTKKMFKEIRNKKTYKKQIANLLTFIRIVIPILTLILSIFAMRLNIVPLFILCGSLAAVGGITDMFDGMISRKTQSTSEYGKLLDQISDKEFAGIIGLNLLFINLNYLGILLGEALIAGINIFYKAKYKNLDITSSKVGKFKMVPLFLTLILGYFAPVSNIFMMISNISILLTLLIQLLTAGSYIIQNNKEVTKLKNESLNQKIQIEEEKEKQKSLELKKKNSIANDLSQIEQLKNIRDVLTQVVIEKQNVETKENSFQKKLKNDHPE